MLCPSITTAAVIFVALRPLGCSFSAAFLSAAPTDLFSMLLNEFLTSSDHRADPWLVSDDESVTCSASGDRSVCDEPEHSTVVAEIDRNLKSYQKSKGRKSPIKQDRNENGFAKGDFVHDKRNPSREGFVIGATKKYCWVQRGNTISPLNEVFRIHNNNVEKAPKPCAHNDLDGFVAAKGASYTQAKNDVGFKYGDRVKVTHAKHKGDYARVVGHTKCYVTSMKEPLGVNAEIIIKRSENMQKVRAG